jgi:hypothetical protein
MIFALQHELKQLAGIAVVFDAENGFRISHNNLPSQGKEQLYNGSSVLILNELKKRTSRRIRKSSMPSDPAFFQKNKNDGRESESINTQRVLMPNLKSFP